MSRPSFAFQPRCALLGLALMLAGCIEPSPRSDITRALNDVSFAPPAPAPGPSPISAGVGPSKPPEAPLQAQIYGGRTVAAQRPATGGAQRSAEGVQLNFEQAEIRDVIKVILGDIIGRSYTVDSDVQGQVTLSTSAPMSEGDLLAVLETVLRANGATLVEASPDTFRIMPVDAAIGRSQVVPLGGRPIAIRPGYGITIVPLRNISATSAAQFIQPLVASPEDIRIDPGRNAILFSGTGVERQNVVETLADLDVDWMAGKAIGLFPLQRANVEAVIPELQAIFAPFDPTGSEPSLIRFLPLARLNAVLAIAGDPEQVREVGSWVSRLDRGEAVGSQFYVYNLKHGAAEDIAKLLNEAFSEGPASGAGPSLAAASATLGAPPPLSEDGEPSPEGFGEQPGQAPAESPASSGPIKVVASKANNSLLIRATPEEYDRIEATLARLDTAPWQVLIEATIAEVTLNNTLRYGVQYFLEQGSFAGGFSQGAAANALQRIRGWFQLSLHPRKQSDQHRRSITPDRRQGPLRPVGRCPGQQRGCLDRRRRKCRSRPSSSRACTRPTPTFSTASSIATPASSCRCGRGSTPTRRCRSRSRRRSAACDNWQRQRNLNPDVHPAQDHQPGQRPERSDRGARRPDPGPARTGAEIACRCSARSQSSAICSAPPATSTIAPS